MRAIWMLTLAPLTLLGGCRGLPGTEAVPQAGGPVNREMARFIATAATSIKDNPAMARLQLEEAQKVDADNGYIDFLFAAVSAREGNFAQASEELERGLKRTHFVQYVDVAPPMGSMPSLPVLRDLGRAAQRVGQQPQGVAVRFLRALHEAGKKVAGSEPVSGVSFLAGVGMATSANRELVALLRARGGGAELEQAQTRQARLLAWEKEARAKLHAQGAGTIGQDVMGTVADGAKLGDEDRRKWLGGEALSEEAQARVDAALQELYESERKLVADLAASMP